MQEREQTTSTQRSPVATLLRPSDQEPLFLPPVSLIASNRGFEIALLDSPMALKLACDTLSRNSAFREQARQDYEKLSSPIVPGTVPADHIMALGRTLRAIHHLIREGTLEKDIEQILHGWSGKMEQYARVHPLPLSEEIGIQNLLDSDQWNSTIQRYGYDASSAWDVFYVSSRAVTPSPEIVPAVRTVSVVPAAEEIQMIQQKIQTQTWGIVALSTIGSAMCTGAVMAPMLELGLPATISLVTTGIVGTAAALYGAVRLKSTIDQLRATHWLRPVDDGVSR